MNYSLGFIGTGNMGQAMILGVLKSGLYQPNEIIVCDLDKEKLTILKKNCKIETTTDSTLVAEKAEIVVLSVKPNVYNTVLESIKTSLDKSKIIVTVAAGRTISSIEDVLGEECRIIRTMPNTPALVSSGMTALCHNKNVSIDDMSKVKRLFESFGKAEIVSESLINPVIGISGSAPAYVFMFIEAMADAAVLQGIPREKAYKFAAQTVMGSAKMVLETGKHPGELKDMVCSPGGTTIEAVASLEKSGFRSAVICAINACVKKAKEMEDQ